MQTKDDIHIGYYIITQPSSAICVRHCRRVCSRNNSSQKAVVGALLSIEKSHSKIPLRFFAQVGIMVISHPLEITWVSRKIETKIKEYISKSI